MTREQAIKRLKEYAQYSYGIYHNGEEDGIAFDMAIETLEQEPIIHCKDCKYWHEWENGTGSCHRSGIMWVGSDYDDYCSFAELKEGDEK